MEFKPKAEPTAAETVQVTHLEKTEHATGDMDAAPPAQKVSIRLVILMMAIIGTYFSTIVHTIGSGLLGHSIVTVVGGQDKLAWITLTLLFPMMAIGPTIAQAADHWGRKPFVISCILCGTVGCVIVSRSNSIGMIIAGQVIGGIAGCAQPLTHAIISEILPRKYRPWAQAAIAIWIAMAALVAIYAGGAMCNHDPAGFRDFFYLTAGLYFTSACIIALFYRPPSRELQRLDLRTKIARLDVPGSLFLASSLLLISLALTWSQNPYEWRNAHILAPFLVGIGLAGCLALYATFYKKDGLLHHGLFQVSRNFAIAEACLFIDGFAFFAQVNYFGYQVGLIYDKDLLQTAHVYSITWYIFVVANPATGYYCSRARSVKPALIASFAGYVFYFSLMASSSFSSISKIYGFSIFGGIGLGVSMTALIVTAQLAIPPELLATATALMLTTRSAGSVVAIAIYNAIFNGAVNSNLVPQVSQVVLEGGLPANVIPELIQGLLSGNPSTVASIAGIDGRLIKAAVAAMKDAFHIAFRNVYIAAAAFTFAALCLSLFLKGQKDEFTHVVEAPLVLNQKEKSIE